MPMESPYAVSNNDSNFGHSDGETFMLTLCRITDDAVLDAWEVVVGCELGRLVGSALVGAGVESEGVGDEGVVSVPEPAAV